VVRRFQVECAGEIAYGGATPCAQIRHFRTKPCFKESQHGSVIEEIGRDKPTAAEGRNDQHRHTETEANRAGYRRTANYCGVRDGRCGYVFARGSRRWRNRCYVIEKSAILIIRHEQNRSCHSAASAAKASTISDRIFSPNSDGAGG